jgi:transposase
MCSARDNAALPALGFPIRRSAGQWLFSAKNGHSAKAVLAVYRLRWQIELAFKRLKSLLHVDRLPTWSERGSRSWLCAHLILALLCDDLSQDVLESSP